MEDIEKLENFFKDIHEFELKEIPEQPITFLEIMGCENKEAMSSNILAFFLDSKEKHGLGDLCLRTLLSFYDPKYQEDAFFVKAVKTEVRTNNGNRIDLWIETEKELIIIENKLYHVANNPFKDYENHANRWIKKASKEKRIELNLVTILLGFENENKSFKFISHFNFLKNLKKEISSLRIENDYTLLLSQYIETMLKKDQSSEIYKMIKSSADFMRNHIEEIKKLEKIKENTCDYYKRQLSNVITMLEKEDLKIDWCTPKSNEYMEYLGAYAYSKINKMSKGNTYELWLAINISSVMLGIRFYKNGSRKDWFSNTINKFSEYISYDEEAKEVYLLNRENIGFSEEEITKLFIESIKKFRTIK